jgi:acetyl esterase/lipase
MSGPGRIAISVLLTVAATLVLSADRPSDIAGESLEAKAAPVARIVAEPLTYARHRQLDVYAGSTPRRGLPVVVMVHACCGDRADLGKLAEAVAAAGAIVMNVDWAGIKKDAQFPDAYADVACAVRFARARAADFGGDSADVTLLGWSDGAMASAVVAAAGDHLDRSQCVYTSASSVPDALIGVAGFYGWTLPVPPVFVNDRARAFLGGTPQQAPRAWHDATPYGWLRSAFPNCVTLVVGVTDPLVENAKSYAAALRGAGHRVRLVVAPSKGDQSMISPRTREGRTTVREALSVGKPCRGEAATGGQSRR